MASVDGVTLHYQQRGAGPDVVMVHGLGANLAFWNLQVAPALADAFRVTTYDLRGHGRSDMPPSGYTARELAAELDRLLEQLGIARAHLVGHSFGAQVALHHALARPERVRTLALADPVLPALQGRPGRGDWRRYVVVSRQLRQAGIALQRQAWGSAYGVLEALADPDLRPERRRAGAGGAFLPFGLWNGSERAARRWKSLLTATTALADFRAGPPLAAEELRRIRHPALATWGQHSRYRAAGRALRRALPQARTAVVPGAGHFHPLVKPGAFTRHLRGFLLEAGGGEPPAPGGAAA